MEDRLRNPYLSHAEPYVGPKRRRKIHVTPREQSGTLSEDVDCIPSEEYVCYDKWEAQHRIDPRVAALEDRYFAGKNILDIGCGMGIASITVSLLFKGTSVTGIDVDPRLVRRARRNLSLAYSRSDAARFPSENSGPPIETLTVNYFPASIAESFGHIPIVRVEADQRSGTIPFQNVDFRCGHWLDELDDSSKEYRYSTILAFSIVKYIHVNCGDGGLESFFNRCYSSIPENGALICEIQPTNEYEKYFRKPSSELIERIRRLRLNTVNCICETLESLGFAVERKLVARGAKGQVLSNILICIKSPTSGLDGKRVRLQSTQ